MRPDSIASSGRDDSFLLLDNLTEQQQDQLALALDAYMIECEEGKAPTIDDFVKRYPEIADHLPAYLQELQWLRSSQRDSSSSAGGSSIDDEMAAQSTAKLSDYTLMEEIGRGAMGIVYRANQKALDRDVAVKVLPFGTVLDQRRIWRFWREARIAAAIQHPSIVSVYAYGRDDGTSFYVMELIEGRSLDKHLKEAIDQRQQGIALRPGSPNPLTDPRRFLRIAEIGMHVADALSAAHRAGIVHRDIKPSNLIIDTHGRVKVTDFGLAMRQSVSDLTQSGEVIGTFRYMSPEQALGVREEIDQRSDVYCLGATLYELATLKPPVEGDSIAQILRTIETGGIVAPRRIDRTIPEALQTIIQRSMRPSKRERYQTADELAADLRRFMLGQRISAAKVSWLDHALDWSRLHIGLVLMTLAAITLLALTTVGFSFLLAMSKNELQNALSQKETHYSQARQAVDSLGLELADQLSDIPEAAEVRQQAMVETLRYYRQFLEESKRDGRLSRDVARTQWDMARLLSKTSSLGEADKLYAATAEAYLDLSRTDASAINDWATVRNEWAMMYAGGVDSLPENVAMAENILKPIADVEGKLSPLSLALTKNNRSVLLIKSNRIDEAMKLATESVELLRNMQRATPADQASASTTRDLAAAMSNLSVLLEKQGKFDEAIEVADQSIALQKADDKKLEPASLHRLALSYGSLGSLYWQNKRYDEAAACFGESVKYLDQVAAGNSGSIQVRWEIAVALNNLGMVLTANESLPAAKDAFQRAITIASAESEAAPTNHIAAHRTSNIFNNLGILFRKQRRHNEATGAFEQAIHYAELASELEPRSTAYQEAYRRITKNLAGE